MAAIADSKCGNPLIFVQEGGRNLVGLRVYLTRLSFVIRPEIGFGSGGGTRTPDLRIMIPLL